MCVCVCMCVHVCVCVCVAFSCDNGTIVTLDTVHLVLQVSSFLVIRMGRARSILQCISFWLNNSLSLNVVS